MSSSNDSAFQAVRSAHKAGYCFTYFNYTDEIEEKLKNCGADYICYGREICPKTKRPHLQGYAYWKNKKNGIVLIKQFPGASWRVSYGTPESNFEYCSKDKDFVEIGARPMTQQEKGKAGTKATKEKYQLLLKLARAGDFDTIEEEYPDVMFNQKDKLIRHYQDAMVDSVPKEHDGLMPGVWIVGAPGNGKSQLARTMALQEYGCDDPYLKPCNNFWWTNYKFQDTVILDDLDPTCCDLSHEFKTWIDRYKTNVRIHHGMLTINPKNFIVTSQYPISVCFKDEEICAAMTRRFPKVIYMTKEDGDDIRESKRQKLITPQEIFGDEPKSPTPI